MADITPATGSVIGVAAGVVLEILGIEVPPLVWSIAGAALAQGYSEVEVSKSRMAVQIISSSFLGAIIGLNIHLLPKLVGVDIAQGLTAAHLQHTTYLFCALGGFAAHPIMKKFLVNIAGEKSGTAK